MEASQSRWVLAAERRRRSELKTGISLLHKWFWELGSGIVLFLAIWKLSVYSCERFIPCINKISCFSFSWIKNNDFCSVIYYGFIRQKIDSSLFNAPLQTTFLSKCSEPVHSMSLFPFARQLFFLIFLNRVSEPQAARFCFGGQAITNLIFDAALRRIVKSRHLFFHYQLTKKKQNTDRFTLDSHELTGSCH